jgi:Bacterial extracellular solute-binding protein, family 7
MERRSFIRHTGLAGVLAAAAAPAVVHAQANVRWRMASSFPKSLDTIFGAADAFAKAVKDMSGGKFEVSVHAGGELVPPFGVVDAVQNATVECAHTAPYYFFGKDETFALGCAIPFGLNSRQMTAWMFEGNGLKLMREFYANYAIISFPMGNTGAQMGGWFRKEIKTVADYKGLKFRMGGFAGRVGERTFRAARSTRRWKKARSTPPNGSAPTTTRSSASTRWRRFITIPAGGKAGRNSICSSTPRLMKACRPSTRRSSMQHRPMRTSICRPSTTPATRVR